MIYCFLSIVKLGGAMILPWIISNGKWLWSFYFLKIFTTWSKISLILLVKVRNN